MAGKIAVVTGGGGMLGSAIGQRLAREGATVVLVDMVLEKARTTAHMIAGEGGSASALQCDVTRADEVQGVMETIHNRYGQIDALINNAGIMPHQDHSVLDMDEAVWQQIYDVNVHGLALCCKFALPSMPDGSAVLNMSSFVAYMGCSNPQEAYGASKGAIIAMTRSLAVQCGPRNIRVNALCPGPILTPHVERFFPTEEDKAIRLARIPLGRFGRPEDVASAVAFLVSDQSSWMTGQALLLDGGISINYF